MQLMWSRIVNIHGQQGKNIPHDLHMEHLNRECKGSIADLGANIIDNAIKRVGKSLHSSSKIVKPFNTLNAIAPQSGYHMVRSSEADIAKLLKQLHEDPRVFLCS
jgi:L1 cell adhesion molecule like protein